ncbi:MAG: T9SS type A sorting domain-containing protein [Saprospiraceae bacterium]|nr:T9SS type A sorting domain-containing protein [Saprospiraceae bacterium]
MKKSILLLLIGIAAVLGAPFTGLSQRVCGTAEYVKMLAAQNPEGAKKHALLEARIASGDASKSLLPNSVVTIPVVVHIVFNNAAENISDEQVYSQIEVLNEDFRLLNTDFALGVPTEFVPFQPLASDIQVQFCLASVDPNGNPTTGITRTATMHGPFTYPTNDMMFAATGGIDAWNTQQYLNLYVCNISGGTLGYAPYPLTASAATDAVVIDVFTFGKFGSAISPYNLGRTTTHEVGHWLNLIHIFADDNPPTCTDSDNVADTPNQLDANGGCPGVTVSCSNGPNGDMSMNYMDYTDDRCMYMFSAGQKSRMLASFSPGGGRDGLAGSGGCGGACPRALFFTDEFSGLNADFQSQDIAIGWNHITNASAVTYQTGDSIRLKPGFHAHNGVSFRAFINPCSGPGVVEPDAEERSDVADALPTPQCIPNPFSNVLQVSFSLPEKASADIVLYDALGRAVVTQYQNTTLPAGEHTITLSTAQLPPGLYYLDLRTPWQHFSRQLVRN